MKRLVVFLVAVIAVASLAIAGCSQSAPAAAPAAPAAAPAKKVAFPDGKPITLIVPFGSGGSTDVGARLAAQYAEKYLNTTIQIVNKPGAGSQVALTEFADMARPDGYTIVGANLPGPITIMLNPERKATIKRDDFIPIAINVVDPAALAVAANGPYKTLDDLLNAAKANPGKLKAATTGLMSDDHLEILDVERQAGVDFAVVHFDSGNEREPALLGGKIDVSFGNIGSFFNLTQQGQLRPLAVMDTQRFELTPDVPTLEELGYKSYGASARGFYAKKGTPKEIVDILADAFNKGINDPEGVDKTKKAGLAWRYMGPAEVEKYWTKVEETVTPLFKIALEETQAQKK